MINGSDERGVFDKNKILSGRPQGLHKGSNTTARQTEEVDIDGMIQKSGCALPYFKLEDCLGEHDRDWRKCQDQVIALRTCSQNRSHNTK